MHDFLIVEIATGHDKLNEDGSSFLIREKFNFPQNIKELLSRAEFGYNVVEIEFFIDVIHFENVWMIQLLQNVKLIEEKGLYFAMFFPINNFNCSELPGHSRAGFFYL